jgi:predicted nucleotidyltransferase
VAVLSRSAAGDVWADYGALKERLRTISFLLLGTNEYNALEGRVCMRRDEVLTVLRKHREGLRADHGIVSLALFGSVARDEANANSDVDLLVEFDNSRRISLFDIVSAAQHIEHLLDLSEDKVDLVIRHNVIPELRDIIYGEAIDVFDAEKMETSRATSS